MAPLYGPIFSYNKKNNFLYRESQLLILHLSSSVSVPCSDFCMCRGNSCVFVVLSLFCKNNNPYTPPRAYGHIYVYTLYMRQEWRSHFLYILTQSPPVISWSPLTCHFSILWESGEKLRHGWNLPCRYKG